MIPGSHRNMPETSSEAAVPALLPALFAEENLFHQTLNRKNIHLTAVPKQKHLMRLNISAANNAHANITLVYISRSKVQVVHLETIPSNRAEKCENKKGIRRKAKQGSLSSQLLL